MAGRNNFHGPLPGIFGIETKNSFGPECKFLSGIFDNKLFKRIANKISDRGRKLSTDLEPLIELRSLSLCKFS